MVHRRRMYTYAHTLGECLCVCDCVCAYNKSVSPLPLVSLEVCGSLCSALCILYVYVCVCVWVGFLTETSRPVCEVIRNG